MDKNRKKKKKSAKRSMTNGLVVDVIYTNKSNTFAAWQISEICMPCTPNSQKFEGVWVSGKKCTSGAS